MVECKYDAWGKLLGTTGSLADTIGKFNPLRYRGYVYDEETGLYYLKSRYYNPEWGRFINADEILGQTGEVLSHNLFAYCRNNSISLDDSAGTWPEWACTLGKIALTAVVVATAVATAVYNPVFRGGGIVGGVSAGITILLGAYDGAKCAVESGGDFWDGFMAGAIGGSVSVFFPGSKLPPDTALRYGVAGRIVSSMTYDVLYELFNTGEIAPENLVMYAWDVTMDASISTVVYYYAPESMLKNAVVNGLCDATVDVFQTKYMFPSSNNNAKTARREVASFRCVCLR